MKQFIRYITLLLFTCICVTAYGGLPANNNQTTSTALSGEAVSEKTVNENPPNIIINSLSILRFHLYY